MRSLVTFESGLCRGHKRGIQAQCDICDSVDSLPHYESFPRQDAHRPGDSPRVKSMESRNSLLWLNTAGVRPSHLFSSAA